MPTRAMEELANVCHFVDWNPGYYLDERERSLAEAFGYDWLHDDPKVRHFASPPAPAGRPAQ